MRTPPLLLLGIAVVLGLIFSAASSARAEAALSTEDFLNRLGVNTHLNGLTKDDPWNTDAAQVAAQLKYLGVRLDRDWAWSVGDGQTWKAVQKAWGPYGRFWTSVDEAGPANQRKDLGYEETIQQDFPGLIYAMGGPNEEDNTYPQSQGATLPDSALVQQSLYTWAHSGGRRVPVSQMEFGAGWTAANGWQGDYNPADTGLHQPYTTGPADFAAAHTYLSNPTQRPVDVLNQLRTLAHLTTPGKPVAHTEFGAYTQAGLSSQVFGQYLVMGALDSAAAGDAAYLVYGLQDSGPEHSPGFFTYPGGAAHEAADDFHTMTTLLGSTRGGYSPGAPRPFTPGSLGASFSNPSVSHLLMQKLTGAFVLAAWSEQTMNGKEHAESETIGFGRSFATVRVYDIEDGLTPIAVRHQVSRYALSMKPSDTYLLVLSDEGGAQAPAAPRVTKAGSLKKGFDTVVRPDGHWRQQVTALRAHWFYSWGGDEPANLPPGVQFVPMDWGYYGNKDNGLMRWLAKVRVQPNVHALLGFNEPDGKDQANLSVDGALEGWPYLMRTGLTLGSPAAVHADGDWMKAFMAGAERKRYRVDFITIHWYGGADPQGFLGYLKRVHNLYHRPLWVTEFAPADWSRHHGVSPQQAADFMRVVLPGMDKLDYVQRYAWYSASPEDAALGTSALFQKDGSLTDLGRLYASL